MLSIKLPKQSLNDAYESSMSEILGYGSFGVVWLGSSVHTNELCAIKSIRKSPPSYACDAEQEMYILSIIQHPFLVRFIEWFEDDIHTHLVMELCAGRELFDVVNDVAESSSPYYFAQDVAATISSCLLEAVRYLHSRDIVHCDIKTENIMIDRIGSSLTGFKLIDLGLAQIRRSDDAPLTKMVGTFEYLSPEVLMSSYDHRIDIWNVGIVTYIILCGNKPFDFETPELIRSAILCGNYVTHTAAWDRIGPSAQDFVAGLLKVDVKERVSVASAMNHNWISKWAQSMIK